MSTAGPVTLAVADAVARLTLDRPESGNAINPELAAALRDRVEEIAARDDVRAVVLAANGKAFCVGGDLGFMAAQDDDEIEGAIRALAADLHAALRGLAAIDAPVIAAVNGVAAGAGMSLVCGADLAIAGTSARFTLAYTRAGLSPDGGATWYLPRIVGMRRAMELALTNEQLDASAAAEAGIVSRVVPDDELDAAADELARKVAAGAAGAQSAVRRLLRASSANTLETQLDDEAATIAALAASPEGREGIAAFLAKRAPDFRGVAADRVAP